MLPLPASAARRSSDDYRAMAIVLRIDDAALLADAPVAAALRVDLARTLLGPIRGEALVREVLVWDPNRSVRRILRAELGRVDGEHPYLSAARDEEAIVDARGERDEHDFAPSLIEGRELGPCRPLAALGNCVGHGVLRAARELVAGRSRAAVRSSGARHHAQDGVAV